MRWLPYLILAYVTLGVQIGLGTYVSWHGASPNLVLIAALFIALNAPRGAALLGCFSLGLLQDLLSTTPPGLYALSYGLVALVVVSANQVISREHSLTHLGLGLFGGLMTAVVLSLHLILRPPGGRVIDAGGAALPAIRGPMLPLFIAAGYTALLAPAMLWALQRFKRPFAFQGSYRRSYR
jgi:rod shape-determining protein MreD